MKPFLSFPEGFFSITAGELVCFSMTSVSFPLFFSFSAVRTQQFQHVHCFRHRYAQLKHTLNPQKVSTWNLSRWQICTTHAHIKHAKPWVSLVNESVMIGSSAFFALSTEFIGIEQMHKHKSLRLCEKRQTLMCLTNANIEIQKNVKPFLSFPEECFFSITAEGALMSFLPEESSS